MAAIVITADESATFLPGLHPVAFVALFALAPAVFPIVPSGKCFRLLDCM